MTEVSNGVVNNPAAAPAAPANSVGTTTGSVSGATQSAPGGASGSDWTTTLSTDHKGYVQNKGFKDPSMVLESYINLEKLVGVPKERLLKIPEKSDDPEWGNIYGRLGRPEKADLYSIPAPKDGKGDPDFTNWAKSAFHEIGLSNAQAEKLSQKWNDYANGSQVKSDGETKAKFEAEATGLKKEWGAAFEQNTKIARQAAQAFGLDAETITKIEDQVGFSKVMKFMHAVGSKIGEDGFTVGGKSSGFGVMTPAQALNKINDLRRDPGFVSRYTNGDHEAKTLMSKLHEYAYPEANA